MCMTCCQAQHEQHQPCQGKEPAALRPAVCSDTWRIKAVPGVWYYGRTTAHDRSIDRSIEGPRSVEMLTD